MNESRRQRLISIAQSLVSEHKTGRKFHVSFILKNNQLLVTGVNNCLRMHLRHKFGEYANLKPDRQYYVAGRHSEIVALNIFINIYGHNDCSGLTLFNVRIGYDGLPKIAKPCSNCAKIVNSCGFKRILWTENE